MHLSARAGVQEANDLSFQSSSSVRRSRHCQFFSSLRAFMQYHPTMVPLIKAQWCVENLIRDAHCYGASLPNPRCVRVSLGDEVARRSATPDTSRFKASQDRSVPTRRAGTSVAAPCDPDDSGTVRASVQARHSNPSLCPPWSALQKPTTHESLKN